MKITDGDFEEDSRVVRVYSEVTDGYHDYQVRQCATLTAQIYVGQRVEYSDTILPIEHAEKFLHRFCDMLGFCVTITPTKFIYTAKDKATGADIDGEEPGFIVGLMQYPMFMIPDRTFRERAESIAAHLKELYQQKKVSIVFPTITQTLI